MSLNFIDPWSATLADDITQISSAKRPDEQMLVLVDTVFTPNLHKTLLAQGQWLPLFAGNPSDEESLYSVSPWVGEWPDLTRLIQTLSTQCSSAPSLSVITTTEPLSILANRLRAFCIAKADGQHFNLRFPDTRKLPSIWDALTPEQKHAFVGPASAWHFVDRNGHWASLPDVMAHDVPPLFELELSQKQFNQIVHDCRADELLFNLLVQNKHTAVRHSQKFHAAREAIKAFDQQNSHADEVSLVDLFDIELARLQIAAPN